MPRKLKLWVRQVRTVSTFPPKDLFTKDARTIACTMASKKVSPKGIGSGMRMIQYFINRAGENLSAARRRELEKAKRILPRPSENRTRKAGSAAIAAGSSRRQSSSPRAVRRSNGVGSTRTDARLHEALEAENGRLRKECAMAVARVTEITASSTKSFDDAVQTGIERANKTLENVKGAWIQQQKVKVEGGRIVEYRVNMKVTFILKN
jgi:hypothetical protein